MKLGRHEVFPNALQNPAQDVDVVENGQKNQQVIEGVPHFLGAQGRYHQGIGDESKASWIGE